MYFDIFPQLKRPQYEVRCLRFRKCSLGQQGRGYRLSFRQFAEWNETLYISDISRCLDILHTISYLSICITSTGGG